MTSTRLTAWSAAFLGVFSLAISACSHLGGTGGTSGPLPYAAPQSVAPPPNHAGLADRGRRAGAKPVDVAIVLRLNRRAQLERLVEQISRPHSGRYHHFLLPREFDERFAPTARQVQTLTRALHRAGFTIVQTYPNGTLIRARAATATVERFFHTQIHDFVQQRYGSRYANVGAIHVPRTIASLVLGVELNDVVYNHTGPARVRSSAAADVAFRPQSADAVRNPGFESGKLKPWYACGTAKTPEAAISKLHPYSGKFDAVTGSPATTSGEPDGTSGICENVTIPPNGVLTAYLYRISNQKKAKKASEIVELLSPQGAVVAVLAKTLKNYAHWIPYTSRSLAAYGGRKVVLLFGVSGDGDGKHFVTQFVDDVRLSTAPGDGPGSPIAGPTYGPDTFNPHGTAERGWAPLAVADGFDFPVQHGYNGTGVTAAVVIDGTINPADLAAYKNEYDVKQTGSIVTEPIASATPYGNDPLETSLDVETISGLAPGAEIVVYQLPDLSNANVDAAYQQILTDAATSGKPHVSVVNSSFDECETEDPAFSAAVESDALQGAAMGITFVAASGDWGSTCYEGSSHPVGVNVPAAAPHVLAVGGNQSYSSDGIANPVAWQNCDAGFNPDYCASGGGVSTVFTPLPTYQAGIANVASTTSRNVPDIAFPAVYDDIYYSGGSYASGFHGLIVGTSWASPIAVALLAEAVQICGPLGSVNPAIYSVYKAHGEAPNFIDVTSGSNAGFMGESTGYSAKPGYDNVTGIGMPNGFTFVTSLCKGT